MKSLLMKSLLEECIAYIFEELAGGELAGGELADEELADEELADEELADEELAGGVYCLYI